MARPDSNRGHHYFQSRDHTSLTVPQCLQTGEFEQTLAGARMPQFAILCRQTGTEINFGTQWRTVAIWAA